MADIKVSQLTEQLTATNDDLVEVVVNAATVPASKKMKRSTLVAGLATEAALASHEANTTNPHGVTAAQVGAPTTATLTAHTSNTSNPHSVTKTQVGLSNVDNTADVNKPVSTATQTTLDAKLNLSGGTLMGDPPMSTDKRIKLNTSLPTNTAAGLIQLKFNDDEAKAIIAYIDKNNNEVIWLQAHDYLSYPSNQHKHFSIEATDAAGLKQTRLGVGYGADNIAVTINQADLTINRNSGITPANGNIIMTGSGLGGNIQHDGALNIYPVRATNSTKSIRLSLDTNSEPTINATGSNTLHIADDLSVGPS